MDAPYPAGSSSRTTQEAVADNITVSGKSARRHTEDGSWRPPAKKPSSLQSRYAASHWASVGQMVDISRPPLYTSDSRKRYKRDEGREGPCDDDFGGGPYAAYDAYRKTSASLFGNPSYEVTRDIRSMLTHPTSDVRTAPPSSAPSTVASPGTPSSPRDSFSFRSSRDTDSLPTTPEQYSRPYHHPRSSRHSDEEEEKEEESLISATKLMRVQSASARGSGPRVDYNYGKDPSRELPPPPVMRPTRSSSPPRASGSSRSHSSGIKEDEDLRELSSRHPLPPPHSTPVSSPHISSRVSAWLGDDDRRTPHHTIQSPPPIAHMPTAPYEPRTTNSSYPEFRRPPYMQQSSYGSTSKSISGNEEDFPIEDETDELEDSGDEVSDGDGETSARPSLKRSNSSSGGPASLSTTGGERPPPGGFKNLKNNGIHYCPHCVASFRRNFDMNRHIASIHAERTDLTCPGCPSRSRPFSRRDALRRHLKSVINQNPTPRRRICNLTPAEASSLMEQLSK